MHKKKKKQTNRVLAAALSVTFTISFVPMPVFAEQKPETVIPVMETIVSEEVSTETDILLTEPASQISEEQTISDTEVMETGADALIEETSEIANDNFHVNYQMHINLQEDIKDICRVTLNYSEEEISVQENDFVQIKIEIADQKDRHYQIEAVQIGDITIFEDATGQTSYENTLQITKDMADVNGDINLTVILTEYYVVQFSYHSSLGTVTPDKEYTIADENDPTKIIGAVRLSQGEKTSITATPAEHYRVDKIKIDGKSETYSENDAVAVKELEENQNHTVEVIFALNRYQIKINDVQENGEVSFCICDDKDNFHPENYCYGGKLALAKYGQTVVGCVKPKENCYISSIRINGKLYEGELTEDKNSWYIFYVEHVTEDMQIDVVMLEHQSAGLTLPERNETYPCYHSDVILKLETDTDGNYPDFASGTYWFEGSEERFPMDVVTKEIMIPKEHNGKDMVVCAEITYTDGHKIPAKSVPFSINSVVPEVGITVTEHTKPEDYQTGNAESGYYWAGRTVTILIDDRADTFPDYQELIQYFTIKKDGQILSDEQKADIIYYQPTVYSSVSEQHDRTVAYLEFKEDGVYDWSFAYVNRAGMQNTEETTIENGENIYHFTIDSVEPTGEIIISGNSWYEKIGKEVSKLLHFGIFTKNNFNVTIEAQDFNSVKKVYYVSHDTEPMQWDALQALSEEEWTDYSDSFTIEESNRYVVYARLTDTSGNRIYLSSDGHVIDHEKCNVELMPDEANENGIYNHNVKVQVAVEEKTEENGTYSGIKKIEYWVTANNEKTQEGILYQFEDENPIYSNLLSEYHSEIIVEAEKNNSYNMLVHVKVTDNAGNETEKELLLKLDATSPEISISYDNNDVRNEKYFNRERTATISVAENNFNSEDVMIKVNDEIMTELVWQDNKIEILFQNDGEYQLVVSYTDKAGNSAVPVSDEFVIDKTKPTGSVTVKENIWYALLENLTFGIFSNDSLNVLITSEDETSDVEKTEYYFCQIQQDETYLSAMHETLEQLPQESWKLYDKPFKIEKDLNESNVVYVKITDKAGNISYLSSDGYIFDNNGCEIIVTPDNTDAKVIHENGKEAVYYHNDVDVEIKVRDKFPYSGIHYVKYWVTVNGERIVDGKDTLQEYIAESEHLETDKNKAYDEWTGHVTIPYNSSDIVLHVEAEDFAGNPSYEELPLDIDKTAPQIAISYDNENGIRDNDGRYYFKEFRTATITFTERTNHFDRNDAINNIFITDIYRGNAEGTYEFGEWTTVAGTSENHDDDKHMITIRYFGDANYHFDISYMDKAGHNNTDLQIGNSIAPYDFTVDTTAPYGSVTAVSDEGRVDTWDEIVDPLSFGFWSKSNI